MLLAKGEGAPKTYAKLKKSICNDKCFLIMKAGVNLKENDGLKKSPD